MCSGPQVNQEIVAELAQICHHKNVFVVVTLTREVLTNYTHRTLKNKLPGLCEQYESRPFLTIFSHDEDTEL